ncbi:MAG: 2Fe-2S iron-sulfur cluster-binding protein, partial [Dehalococcoidia bacterium]
MDTITLAIDGLEVRARAGATVLETAQSAGIYIPRLCFHPDLPPSRETKALDSIYRGRELIKGTDPDKGFEGCGLCVVEIEGREDLPTACTTPVAQDMVVHTNTPQVLELRRNNLVPILATHPHACLTCAQREGCSREPCSLKVAVTDRCCPKFGRCELQKIAEYIGIKQDVPRYVFRDLPIAKDEPFFDRDYNLCIGCLRCVRVCQEVRGVGALGFVYRGDEVIVGTTGPSLKESQCRFCGACAEVCPTGALMDR